MMIRTSVLVLGLAVLAAGAYAARPDKADKDKEKKVDKRIFEMRTYYAAEGKMTALHARFRDHTCKHY